MSAKDSEAAGSSYRTTSKESFVIKGECTPSPTMRQTNEEIVSLKGQKDKKAIEEMMNAMKSRPGVIQIGGDIEKAIVLKYQAPVDDEVEPKPKKKKKKKKKEKKKKKKDMASTGTVTPPPTQDDDTITKKEMTSTGTVTDPPPIMVDSGTSTIPKMTTTQPTMTTPVTTRTLGVSVTPPPTRDVDTMTSKEKKKEMTSTGTVTDPPPIMVASGTWTTPKTTTTQPTMTTPVTTRTLGVSVTPPPTREDETMTNNPVLEAVGVSAVPETDDKSTATDAGPTLVNKGVGGSLEVTPPPTPEPTPMSSIGVLHKPQTDTKCCMASTQMRNQESSTEPLPTADKEISVLPEVTHTSCSPIPPEVCSLGISAVTEHKTCSLSTTDLFYMRTTATDPLKISTDNTQTMTEIRTYRNMASGTKVRDFKKLKMLGLEMQEMQRQREEILRLTRDLLAQQPPVLPSVTEATEFSSYLSSQSDTSSCVPARICSCMLCRECLQNTMMRSNQYCVPETPTETELTYSVSRPRRRVHSLIIMEASKAVEEPPTPKVFAGRPVRVRTPSNLEGWIYEHW